MRPILILFGSNLMQMCGTVWGISLVVGALFGLVSYHDHCWNSKFGSLSEDRNFTIGLWLCSPSKAWAPAKYSKQIHVLTCKWCNQWFRYWDYDIEVRWFISMTTWLEDWTICYHLLVFWEFCLILDNFIHRDSPSKDGHLVTCGGKTPGVSLEETDWPAPSCSPSRILQRPPPPWPSHVGTGSLLIWVGGNPMKGRSTLRCTVESELPSAIPSEAPRIC